VFWAHSQPNNSREGMLYPRYLYRSLQLPRRLRRARILENALEAFVGELAATAAARSG